MFNGIIQILNINSIHMKTSVIRALFILLSAGMVSVSYAQSGNTAKKVNVNLPSSKINWIGKKPAGEHNGYVKLSSGTIEIANNEVTGGSFVIDLKSIVNLDVENRDMNERLVNHLKSADFFDVEKYPQARFVITKVSRLSRSDSGNPAATHKVEGNLTIKSITHQITFNASINVLNGKVTATSTPFTIDRTQWSVNYQSKSVFAELKDQFIYDDITLSLDLTSE